MERSWITEVKGTFLKIGYDVEIVAESLLGLSKPKLLKRRLSRKKPKLFYSPVSSLLARNCLNSLKANGRKDSV